MWNYECRGVFHISHNKYNSDNDTEKDEIEYSDETINRYNNHTLQDLQDIDLLQVQWKAQLMLVLGYLFEYTASIQGINILQSRIERRNEIFQAGEYDEKEESELINEIGEEFEAIGINADATAVLAAQLELFGQTILTNIYWTKYQRLSQNVDIQDFLVTKTANREILIGAIFEEIAYVFNLIGVSTLYQLNNIDNANDVDDE